MHIVYFGKGDFQIKSKQAIITLGENCQINDFTIPGPGEYEVAGIRVESFDGILFFVIEGLITAYLDRRKKPLTEKETEKLEDVDILFIPIGGGEVYSPEEAWQVIKDIEPKIIFPMHYQNLKTFSRLEGVSPEILDEIKIKGELPEEISRRIIILNAKTR